MFDFLHAIGIIIGYAIVSVAFGYLTVHGSRLFTRLQNKKDDRSEMSILSGIVAGVVFFIIVLSVKIGSLM